MAPGMHHFVVDPSPHCSGPFYSSFASHADNAARPSSSSGLLKGVKGNKVHVRVVLVVSGFVVNRQDVTCFAVGELLSEGACQCFSLPRRGFHGKGDDEALSHPAFPLLSAVLRCLCSVPVSGVHTLSKNNTSSLGAGDVTQMGCHLPRFRRPSHPFAFF